MGGWRKIVAFSAVTLLASFVFLLLCNTILFNVGDTGTATSVLTSKSEVIRYLKDEYDDFSVTVISGRETKLNSKNYDQSEILDYYNKNHSKKISDSTGICWVAAQTSVLKFNGVTENKNAVGSEVISKAINNSYWDGTGGFNFKKADTLLTKMFSKYKINKKGNNDRYDIYDTLCDEVDDGRVCIFKVKGHEMTGCGYVTYDVIYFVNNGFGVPTVMTKKEQFVIVNDTWSNTRQYSYFPEDEIGTSLFSRWDFGITKVKKK